MKKILLFLLGAIILNCVRVSAQSTPDLGALSNYALFSGNDIKNDSYEYVTGFTGAVGSFSGNAIKADSILAGEDLQTLSTLLFGISTDINNLDHTIETATVLNSMSFSAGVYQLTGNISLEANEKIILEGTSSDIFIFDIAGDLDFGPSSKIDYGQIRPENVFWNVNGGITLGDGAELYGIFISTNNIKVNGQTFGYKSLFALNDIELGAEAWELTSRSIMLLLTISTEEALNSDATNLVNNYSFEVYSMCPYKGGAVENALHWSNAGTPLPNVGGGDHLACRNNPTPYYGIPKNDFGIEEPKSGEAYGGLYIFANRTTTQPGGYREFLRNRLISPLAAGQLYQVEFYISAGDYNQTFCNNMAAYFTQTPVTFSHGANAVTPQVIVTNIVDQTIGWYKVEGLFVASGGEQYVTFGNFKDDDNTSAYPRPVSGSLVDDAYYYLDDIFVRALSSLTADAGTDKCLDATTTSVQLGGSPTSTGCNGSYVYKWKPSTGLSADNVPNPIASPTVSTKYTLTVTDGGCIARDEVYVSVGSPQLLISYNKYGNCEDDMIVFANQSTNFTECIWDFGDGTPTLTTASNIKFVPHYYAAPGYYRLEVTAINGCTSKSHRENYTIYITPSIAGGYNNQCAIKTRAFINPFSNADDITVTALASPIASPIEWNSSTVSSTSGVFEIKGELRIKAGAGLKIKNITVKFGPQGTIVVERGAHLILDGCTLGGITSPNMMWQGIEVHGDGQDAYAGNQGKLTMTNGATIQDAHVAVTLGMPEIQRISTANPTMYYNWHAGFGGGGIIKADGAVFNRNANSIRFWEYNYINSSEIKNCNFISKNGNTNTHLLDPYYWRAQENYMDLKGHNPQYLGTWPDIDWVWFGRPSQAIDMTGVRGVKVTNNTFDYINNPIALNNCRATQVKDNLIQNTHRGIRSRGLFDIYSNNVVYRNTMNDILFSSIISTGTNGDVIQENSLNPLAGIAVYKSSDTAIVMQSSNYFITDNIVRGYGNSLSVYAGNANPSYGLVGVKQSGNTFTSPIHSPFILTTGNNAHLRIRCNNFQYEPLSNRTHSAWEIDGSLGNQGTPPVIVGGIPSKKTPAGNLFDVVGLYPDRRIDAAYKVGSSTYFHHLNDFTIPQLIVTSQQMFNHNNQVDYTDFNSSCAPEIGNEPIVIKNHVNAMRTAKKTLLQEMSTIASGLDNNATEVVQTATEFEADNGVLTDLLVDSSPLSDAVMNSLVHRVNLLDENQLFNVLLPNLPVADEIWGDLQQMISDNYSGALADTVLVLQGYNPNARTITWIKREVEEVETDKMLTLLDLLAYYQENDLVDSVIANLQEENSNATNKMLAGYYLSENEMDDFANYLGLVSINNSEDQLFYDYMGLLADINTNENGIWNMDSVQKSQLYAIALDCPKGMTALQASNLVELVYGDTLNCPLNGSRTGNFAGDKTTSERKRNADISKVQGYLGDNYPNPFNGTTSIPYQLPKDVNSGKISITDITGKPIAEYPLGENRGILRIDRSTLPDGLYFYRLTVKGAVLGTKKMVILAQ